MPAVSSKLSRTLSTTSVSSDTTTSSTASSSTTTARRTRTRFTNVQLMMLERLYHRTTHPTRNEREDLARETGMETKHVTIWFQNKRQSERKGALHNATNRLNNRTNPSHNLQTSSRTLSLSSAQVASTVPRTKLLSLDRIAARSELRAPHTPTRQPNPHAPLWENMPSSPPGPPGSPESVREVTYVEFGKQRVEARGRRTLEWACAAARVTANESADASMDLDLDDLCGDETDEEEVHEAVTPNGSFEYGIQDVGTMQSLKATAAAMKLQDEDIMAAYVLCGLGRTKT